MQVSRIDRLLPWFGLPTLFTEVKERCIFGSMHASTRQKLEAFARTVDWAVLHPLHRRKFQRFVLEAFARGDTRLSAGEIEQIVVPPRLEGILASLQSLSTLSKTERGPTPIVSNRLPATSQPVLSWMMPTTSVTSG
jgi:hypothetical protein